MGGDRSLAKSDAAENELAKLPFEIGGIAILNTRRCRQPRHGCGENSVMRKPEQVQRCAADLDRIARFNRALERGDEGRSDQVGDLAVEQTRKLTVLEMARRHEAQALHLFLV